MKVEVQVGIASDHLAHEGSGLLRIEDAERVGQHETLHTAVLQRIDKSKHIVDVVLHAVRPVLQIEVDMDAQFVGIVDAAADVRHMLLEGLLQLEAAMPFAALAEQVDILASAVGNPIQRGLSVNKAKHLHTIQHASLTRPPADVGDGLLLAIGHTCRGHLDAIHIQVHQQHARNHQLLVRHKAHAIGLLAVAERRVHDFYELIHALSSFSAAKLRKKALNL